MPMAGRHPIEEGGSERPSRTILMPTTWGNSGPMESPNDASRTHEVHADVLEKRLTSEDFGHELTFFDSMGPGRFQPPGVFRCLQPTHRARIGDRMLNFTADGKGDAMDQVRRASPEGCMRFFREPSKAAYV